MIIAIDPGLSGGIAWTDHNVEAEATKMPYTPKGILDYLAYLKNIYDENCSAERCVCYLEEIKGVPPNQSSKATWTFAEHCGTLKGFLMALGIPIVFVKPQVWQKAIGATRPSTPKGASKATKERIKAEGKRNIRQIVEARYPNLKVTLATSDALGILMYAEREERK